MEPTAEVAQLKAEVAALREAVNALKYFLHIEPVGTTERAGAGLHIRCTSVSLVHPDAPFDPQRLQALFSAGKEGPMLALNGQDASPRMVLSVAEGRARCDLLTKELRPAVRLQSEDAATSGQIVVYDQGQARAALQADAKGGLVTVRHGDGVAGAALRTDARGGELRILDGKGQVTAKVFNHGPDGASFVVNNEAGRPAAVMSTVEAGGTFMTFNPKEKVSAALLTLPAGGALMLHGPEEKNTVSLHSNVQGGCLRVHDAAGKTAAEMSAGAQGGALLVCDQEGRERADLRMMEGGPMLVLRNEAKQPALTLAGIKGEGVMHLHNPAGALTVLQVTSAGSALSMLDAEKKVQFHAGHGDGKVGLHLLPHADANSAVALITTPFGGAVQVSAPDGGRRAGVCAAPDGGQLSVFNDLGIERALIGSMGDGGLLRLNWGGTMGVAATATDKGGLLVVNDAEGNAAGTFPPTVGGD